MSVLHETYRGRRVLVTGHTGFKGSWLCHWLLRLGAVVRGYALDPPTTPALFNDLGLQTRMDDIRADVRDRSKLQREVRRFEPEFIFHLAAQPLVRASYESPVETYDINVMGTVNLLDSVRGGRFPCAAVIVTTDKCYENREWPYGYRENDPMGGADPYSSSKGMVELAVAAWRRSYCGDGRVRLASARAGNVIGGGDWAVDRIVPDCIRAVQRGEAVDVRNPASIRPWQHVLEPLSGYLAIAAHIDPRKAYTPDFQTLCSAFNFGPDAGANRTVLDVVERLLLTVGGNWRNLSRHTGPREAVLLQVAIDKARFQLGWSPKMTFEMSVDQTAAWYRGYLDGESPLALTDNCINHYETLFR